MADMVAGETRLASTDSSRIAISGRWPEAEAARTASSAKARFISPCYSVTTTFFLEPSSPEPLGPCP